MPSSGFFSEIIEPGMLTIAGNSPKIKKRAVLRKVSSGRMHDLYVAFTPSAILVPAAMGIDIQEDVRRERLLVAASEEIGTLLSRYVRALAPSDGKVVLPLIGILSSPGKSA
jgi:hypothetical protein